MMNETNCTSLVEGANLIDVGAACSILICNEQACAVFEGLSQILVNQIVWDACLVPNGHLNCSLICSSFLLIFIYSAI